MSNKLISINIKTAKKNGKTFLKINGFQIIRKGWEHYSLQIGGMNQELCSWAGYKLKVVVKDFLEDEEFFPKAN